MRGGAARRHQRRAQPYRHLLVAHALQALQGFEQRLERAGRQGARGVGAFMRLKFMQTVVVVHALGFVREQHGVAVKGNAQFVGVAVSIDMRVGKHLRGREVGLQRLAHIIGIGRQKKVGTQWREEFVGRTAAREHAAFHFQPAFFCRAKHAQARNRVVAREDDDFYPLFAVCIESQQFFHQRKSHTRLGGLLQPIQLQLHVGAVVLLFEHAVFFFEIEQRPRRERNDQQIVQ